MKNEIRGLIWSYKEGLPKVYSDQDLHIRLGLKSIIHWCCQFLWQSARKEFIRNQIEQDNKLGLPIGMV